LSLDENPNVWLLPKSDPLKEKEKRKVAASGVGMAVGWGEAEGWGLCSRPAWFCLAHPCLIPHDGENSHPIPAPWGPTKPRPIPLNSTFC